MSYANALIENIEVLGVLNESNDSYRSTHSEFIWDDLRRLNTLNERFGLKPNTWSADFLRYLLNNEELLEGLNRDDLEYIRFLNYVKNIATPKDILKLDKSGIDYLIINNPKDKYVNKAVVRFCLKNNMTDKDSIIRISKIVKNDYSYMDYNGAHEYYLDKLKYKIDNNLDSLNPDLVAKIINNKIEDEEIFKYLRFLSKLDIPLKHIKIALSKDNLSNRMEYYNEIVNLFEDELSKDLIKVLEYHKFTTKEVKTLVYKLKNKKEFIGNIQNHKDILQFIYPNYKQIEEHNLDDKFAHYILKNSKKKFLKTLEELEEVIYSNSNICKYYIYKLVNLNLLTEAQIKEINSKWCSPYEDTLKKALSKGLKNISFNEYKLLTKLEGFKKEVYFELIDLDVKVDDRIRLIKDIPVSNEYKLNVKEVARFIKEKSLSDRINIEHSHIKKNRGNNLTNNQWLEYLLIPNLDLLKSQVTNEFDVLFFIQFKKDLMNYAHYDFKIAKKEIYVKSDTYKSFVKRLNASEDFISNYKNSIFNFYTSGMMDKFLIYYSNLGRNRDNLVKITKAEIANQLSELKFYKDDLEKEIDYNISSEDKQLWECNVCDFESVFKIEEVYDYDTIIQLGEIPTRTCMSYKDGCYNYCLLSNFDANKKVLVVKNKDGEILARAILRLTKMSNKSISEVYKNGSSNILEFIDVEDINKDIKQVKAEEYKESLVLFLEKCYTDNDNIEYMQNLLIKLAYKKASSMNLRLMISKSYSYDCKVFSEIKEELQAKSKSYIYISKSKNGIQYLDSFGGRNTNNDTKYIKCDKYRILLQENMFDKDLEIR